MILYLISGRGFTASNVGRKLSEVIRCFKDVGETEVIFGGDVPVEQTIVASPTSRSDYHAKWYRKNRIMLFFSESFSKTMGRTLSLTAE